MSVPLDLPDEMVRAEAHDRLRLVLDPELGVSVVDLGLVYEVRARGGEVGVVMTLTTPGCPLGESLAEAVERALSTVPGVHAVSVELVWDPPWKPDMMTASARRELGWT